MGSGSGTHRAYTPFAGAGSPEPLFHLGGGQVYGIIISNVGGFAADTFTFQTYNYAAGLPTRRIYFRTFVALNATVTIDLEWYAELGLEVVSNGTSLDADVTVFYDGPTPSNPLTGH